MTRSLPSVMDLLALSLAAGMGLDRALRTVCEHVSSPLTDEIRHVLRDVDLGLSRRDALVRMAERVPLADVRALTAAIIQSEELSASLVATMQTEARRIRLSRRRSAEADALRVPIKMMIPMVLLVLPALFLILMGPAALQLVGGLSRG
ncbi:MAG: tight adherence protein [Chloroflexota bacterium]|jgi:tight adherence protein C|nr:tight adherence protein [Chloroflexota bacterium]